MDLQYLKGSEARRLSQGADEEFKMLKVSLWLMECLGRLLFISLSDAWGGRREMSWQLLHKTEVTEAHMPNNL
jgi:hypothetical protein